MTTPEKPFDYAVIGPKNNVVYSNGSLKSATDEAKRFTENSNKPHVVVQFVDLVYPTKLIRCLTSN